MVNRLCMILEEIWFEVFIFGKYLLKIFCIIIIWKFIKRDKCLGFEENIKYFILFCVFIYVFNLIDL